MVGIPEFMAMEAMARTGSDWLTKAILEKERKKQEEESFIKKALGDIELERMRRGELVSVAMPSRTEVPGEYFTGKPSPNLSLGGFLSEKAPLTQIPATLEKPISSEEQLSLIESVYRGKPRPAGIEYKPTEIPTELKPKSYKAPSGVEYAIPMEDASIRAARIEEARLKIRQGYSGQSADELNKLIDNIKAQGDKRFPQRIVETYNILPGLLDLQTKADYESYLAQLDELNKLYAEKISGAKKILSEKSKTEKTIRVKVKSTNKTGLIKESEFDSKLYERL